MLNGFHTQIQAKASKDWAVHIEATDVTDKVYRISLSNIYKSGKVSTTSHMQ